MRNTFISLSALSLALLSSPAFAADEDVASKELTITGTVAATTDYRFRGISQTNEKFAIQGGATATHSSGLYASFWASSIDDYVYYGADAELDLIAGFSKTVNGFTLDGGVLYYVYASAKKGFNTDFFEPYGSIKYTYGPVTGKAGFAYAWKQSALDVGFGREDNLYLYGELSAAIPNTPFAISGHLGYTKGRSALTLGQKDYMDWNITGSYTWKNITVGVTYVDTDFKKNSPYLYFPGLDFGNAHPRNGYDLVDASVLGSVTYAF